MKHDKLKYDEYDEVLMEKPKCTVLKSSKRNRVIKLWRTIKCPSPINGEFKNPVNVEREFNNSIMVNNLPFKKPKFIQKMHVEDKIGLVYEYIDGQTVRSMMESHQEEDPPEYAEYASYTSSLHKDILKCKAPRGVISWKQRLKPKILKSVIHSSKEKKDAVKLLETLPDSEYLCHGSLHDGNVLVSGGVPYAIDMATITSGPALYDIAKVVCATHQRYNISLHQKNRPDDWQLMMKQRESFAKHYMEQMEVSWEDIEDYYHLIYMHKSGRPRYYYQMPDGHFGD